MIGGGVNRFAVVIATFFCLTASFSAVAQQRFANYRDAISSYAGDWNRNEMRCSDELKSCDPGYLGQDVTVLDDENNIVADYSESNQGTPYLQISVFSSGKWRDISKNVLPDGDKNGYRAVEGPPGEFRIKKKRTGEVFVFVPNIFVKVTPRRK